MPDLPLPIWVTRVGRRLRSVNPYLVDAILAALVMLVFAGLPILARQPGETIPGTWLGYLLGAGTALPIVWRRRAPFVCALLVGAATIGVSLYRSPGQQLIYGGLIVIYTVAARGLPWQRLALLYIWLAGVAILGPLRHDTLAKYAFNYLIVLTAYALGALARMRHSYTAALEERARGLERDRELETARATAHERARIARDMHDILAHAVSLMVVQAEAGPVVVRSDPARAEAAFEAIATAGREAMDQLSRMLGLLKDDDPSRAPQPTIAGLADLVDQVNRAGLQVELQSTANPQTVPSDVEVAAYRVVQEALTNTVKHAAAATAVVRLSWADDALVVTVTDDGQGMRESQGGGHGLIGIRERAAACGGTATAGPGPGGRGFVVTAHLPIITTYQDVRQ